MFSIEIINEQVDAMIAPNGNHNASQSPTIVWDFDA
jgi:hypothetical protein